MTINDYVDLIKAGGSGSGCNPDVGKCGRPPGAGGKQKTVGKHAREVQLNWRMHKDLNNVKDRFTVWVNNHRISVRREESPTRPGKNRWYVYVDGQNTGDYYADSIKARLGVEKNIDKYAGPGAKQFLPQEKPVAERPAAQPFQAPPSREGISPEEQKLQESPITRKERIGDGGVNGTYKLKLEDGTVAIWKPRDEETNWLVQAMDGRRLYKGEIMAYEVAKIVGADVPETVKRTIEGTVGSVQKWTKGTRADNYYGNMDWNKNVDQDNARMGASFDWISGNPDRHKGNYLIDDSTGKLQFKLIDHGQVFGKSERGGRNSEILRYVAQNEKQIPQALKDHWQSNKETIRATVLKNGALQQHMGAFDARYEKFMSATNWSDIASKDYY